MEKSFRGDKPFYRQTSDYWADKEDLPRTSQRRTSGLLLRGLLLSSYEKPAEVRNSNTFVRTKRERLTESMKLAMYGKKPSPERKPIRKIFKPREKIIRPELGEPGGLDDPHRFGLSGAGVKWYLRFINQGFKPEEARKKVDERKLAQAISKQVITGTGKRENKHPSLPKHEIEKKRRTEEVALETRITTAEVKVEAPTFNDSTEITQVAVLPKDYPQSFLTHKELTALEDALVEEMTKGWETELKFEGISFKSGSLLIDCTNEKTANWLHEAVPNLSAWKGCALTTCPGDEMLMPYNLSIFLPRSAGVEHCKSLALIKQQNSQLDTHEWKILSCKEEGDGQLVTIGVDEKSMKAIIINNYMIYYRLGKIPVCVLKKPSE